MTRYARADKPAPQGASDHLLDEIERRACRFFYEMADPNTGLVRDRATASEPYAPSVSSIAATGFGLSALAIAAKRRYIDRTLAEAHESKRRMHLLTQLVTRWQKTPETRAAAGRVQERLIDQLLHERVRSF